MKISYEWLRELTGVELTAADLRERLTMAGLEVEGLHEAADGDFVLEMAVLSNRPDLLSHLGVAREVGVSTGVSVRLAQAEPASLSGRAGELTAVEVRDSQLCPRYAARVVRGVRVAPSPEWLIKRLQAIGQRPINNIADITNYVMHELGQPLHAFDLDKLTERRIVVRRAQAGEKITTLDGTARELDAEMLVIADAVRPVAVAGVMGGADSEISDATRDVLIESAYFDPASVRRTARTLGLQTDASDRFERGVDYAGVLRAQQRAVALICELAGGAATEDALDIYPQPIAPPVVALRFARVRGLTGLDVPPHEALRILNALGFELTGAASEAAGKHTMPEFAGQANLDAQVAPNAVAFNCPTWRADVQIEEDLVEEVGRHFGFWQIEDALPPSPVAGEYRAHENRRRAARQALAARGFDEALSFSFTEAAHDGQYELLPGLIVRAEESFPFITLGNPIIEDAARMRATLVPGLLAAARHNFNHGTRDVRLFETGRVFAAHEEAGHLPHEREACALVATGGALEANRAAAPRELDFYDLKGALEATADAMNLPALEFVAARVKHLREGQAARVLLGGREIGSAGRLADELATVYKFRQPVYVAEVDFSALLEAPEAPARYTPLSRFPSVVRDVSLVADRRVAFAEMRRAAFDLNLEALRGVALVYTYEGEKVPVGCRSVTLRFEYRADERTLRDEEVDALHAQIISTLEQKFSRQSQP